MKLYNYKNTLYLCSISPLQTKQFNIKIGVKDLDIAMVGALYLERFSAFGSKTYNQITIANFGTPAENLFFNTRAYSFIKKTRSEKCQKNMLEG